MVVKNRIVVGLCALLIFIGCNNKKEYGTIKKGTNTEEIISKVIDSIALYTSPKNLSPITSKGRFTKQDSIRVKEQLLNYIQSFKTIAIDTSLVLYIHNFKLSEEMFLTDKFSGFGKVYDSTGKIHIDINKIKLKKVTKTFYFDSIVYLNPSEHIGKYRDYKNIFYRFNFSKIMYNDTKEKAIVRCQYRFEDRSANMEIYFLEKTNNIWGITKKHQFLF